MTGRATLKPPGPMARSMDRRARLVWAILGATALPFSGCLEDPPGGDISFTVAETEIEEGHCTWGVRNGGYGPEWCHIIVVEATNHHPVHDADVSSTAWEAEGDDRGTYGFPSVAGDGVLPAGETATIELRFDVSNEVRFRVLRHETLHGETTTAEVPDHS